MMMSMSDDRRTFGSQSAAPNVLLEICSTFDMLKVVDQVSEQFAQLVGLDEDAAHCLWVSVREAVVNGIKHGNSEDCRKRVRIEFAVVDGDQRPRVVVRVCDEGSGFNVEGIADPLAPENVSGTGGRGVFLMRSFMDDVQVGRTAGGGTEIVMTKSLTRTI